MKGPEAEFFDHLQAGKFMLQRTADSAFVFYPRVLQQEWTWTEVSGAGTVYSRTIIRQKPERGGDYCIAIVTLAEGPRMMTRILGAAPNAVTIGMPVRASIEQPMWDNADTPVVVFRPVNG
jgi:uncharacterized protein